VAVEGSIGSLEKLTFIVDTGAYPSMVDQRIATALGLSEIDGKVGLVNQTVQTNKPSLPPCRSLPLVPLASKTFQFWCGTFPPSRKL
jgi:Aspartyl protease